MPVILVTDTDVAAVPFAKDPAYSFRLNAQNKGPFAAMLPLSHVLDPAKEQACIESLAGQFSQIPIAKIHNIFLGDNASYYLKNGVLHAEHRGSGSVVAEKLLKKAMTAPDAIYYEDHVTGKIKRYAETNQVGSAEEMIGHFAKAHNIPPSEAAYALLEDITRHDMFAIPKINAELEATKFHADRLAAGEAARLAQARRLAEPFEGQAAAKLTAALMMPRDSGLDEATETALKEALPSLTLKQRTAVIDRIAEAAHSHKLKAPGTDLMGIVARETDDAIHGAPLRFTIEEAQVAGTLAMSPSSSAQQHYAAMKAKAVANTIMPGIPAAQYAEDLERGLASCKPWIRNCAEAGYKRVVIVPEGVNINHIVPNKMGMMLLSQMGGGSTGVGIYAKASLLKSPKLLKEEVFHEVEKDLFDGKFFTLQPSWKKAIALNTQQGKDNPLFAYLMHHPIIFDAAGKQKKANNAIGPMMPPLHADDPNLVKFVEAGPDVEHYEDIAKQILTEKGKIRIGGNFFGFGGTTYRTSDEVMRAAFPDAWQLLEGPAQGMQLIQHESGKVEQILHTARPPAGTEAVLSLRECCERRMERLAQVAEATGEQSIPAATRIAKRVSGAMILAAEWAERIGPKVARIIH